MEAIPGGKKKADQALHEKIAISVIGAARVCDTPYMNVMTPDGSLATYQYFDGIWGEVKSLEVAIARQMATFGHTSTAKMRGEVEKWIRCYPEITNEDLEFDRHGMIPCANGLLDPNTLVLRDYGPDDLATAKGALEYVEGAQSPLFDGLMKSFFEDRPADECRSLIDLMQEFFGASLALPMLPREARKALLGVGPTRSGKTVLADIFKLFMGGRSAAPSIEELSGRFGLESLYGASCWVRDDAINEGDKLDPQRFKVVVTGETVDVARKNRSAVRHQFTIPVFLTTNALPEAKDASDAIYNRSLIVKFTKTRTEEEAILLRRKYGVPKTSNLARHLIDTEGPGILNWALLGFLRVYERGMYVIPEAVRSATQSFKDKNNPIGEWAREAVEYDPDYKVHKTDLNCCFNGWEREMYGDVRPTSAKRFVPQFRELFPLSRETHDGPAGRYFTGVRLTEMGRMWWAQHNLEQLKGGAKGSAGTVEQTVNKRLSKW
jgi:P4 family phage/plasmid primase-like protien